MRNKWETREKEKQIRSLKVKAAEQGRDTWPEEKKKKSTHEQRNGWIDNEKEVYSVHRKRDRGRERKVESERKISEKETERKDGERR